MESKIVKDNHGNERFRTDGMTMMPFGPPVYQGNMRSDIIHELQTVIDQVRGNDERDMGDRLAGRVREQYEISDLVSQSVYDHIFQHLQNYIEGIEGTTGYPADELKNGYNYGVDALWANVQKEREYQPPHMHDGMFSFVIYTQNDITHAEALNNEFDKKKEGQSKLGGMFELRFGEANFMNFTQFNKYPQQGDIIMFPSWVTHHVNSFYKEDAERISVAGNIQNMFPQEMENPYDE